jgi:Trypsin-like peptidase domain
VTTARDQSLAAKVVVRVLDGAGDVVGAGFLIGPDLVATCAHVVASAQHADPYAVEPAGDGVRLDFPMFRDGDAVPATEGEVVRWVPIGEDGTGDIAVLRVRGPLPAGARMPPVRRVDQLWDLPFRVLGFPEGMADGVWSTGRFRGEQGTRWFQMQTAAGEQPVVEGFSGAPVWDEGTGAVVGMTVAADASGTTTTAYLIPIDQVLGLDPELLPCPYRGLEPFGEEHAAYFFGREADVEVLAATVARQPLVAVTGPSGAGKSSLVRAGLLPRLRAAGAEVAELRPVPGRPVGESLVTALHPYAPADQPLPEGPDDRERVRELAAAAPPDLVLLVDQFEELAAGDPDAARELLELIGELVGPGDSEPGRRRPRAVLTLRSATIDEVVVPGIAGLLGAGTVLVPPMDRSQLRDAIVAPAERAPGLAFEPGLVDRILDDAAGEPGGLPLVESLLTELWERREGGNLTLRAYEEAGGVAGVVATHAENVVAGFPDPADGSRLKRLFTALSGSDRDGRFVRRPRRWDELAPDLRPLVQRLAAGRLVVVERAPTGEETVQLAHQALIAHWPRLRDWLTEDRDFLAWRDQLDQQRERWESTGRDDGALLRGTALAVAQDWLPRRQADVPGPGQDYVQRSRARQRREVRRWRVVTAVLAVLALAAGALAAVAVTRGNEVDAQLRLANAEILAQASLARAPNDPAAATQLALAAWRLNPENASARTALLRQYMAMSSVEGVLPAVTTEPLLGFDMSNDGRTMLLPEGGGIVAVSGLPLGPVRRHVLAGAPPGIQRMALSDEGRWAAAIGSDGEVLLWDLATGAGPQVLSRSASTGPPRPMISITHDQVLWLDRDDPTAARQRIWDLPTGRPAAHDGFPVPDPDVSNATPIPGADVVLVRLGDPEQPGARLVVRRLTDGAELGMLPEGTEVPEHGEWAVTCEPGTSAANPTTAVVLRPDLGGEARRVQLLGSDCVGFRQRITRDVRHVAERIGPPGDYDVVRIRDLDDGTAFDVTLPPDPSTEGDGGLGVGSKMFVLRNPDGTRTVLLPRGTSVLRLRAEPNPFVSIDVSAPRLSLAQDERTLVATDPQQGYIAFDRGTARPVGRLDRSLVPPPDRGGSTVDGDRLTILAGTPEAGWTLSQYQLPSLAPAIRVAVPQRPGGPPSAVGAVSTGDRLFTFGDGLLAEWDRSTGAPVGAPVDLATTPAARDWYRTRSVFSARPGHPDQAVVYGPDDSVELWDVARGQKLAALPHIEGRRPYAFEFDDTGTRLLTVTQVGVMDLWDLDRLELVARPIPVPGYQLPLGITTDGRVVTGRRQGEEQLQTFWDIATGAENGTIRLSAAQDHGLSVDDGMWMDVSSAGGAAGGSLPHRMALTAQQWFDQLCTFSHRPFSDEERALLPAGASTDPPC